MNETDFNAKQKAGMVEQVKPPQPPTPDVQTMLEDLQRRFNSYVPFLDALRVGTPIIGKTHLSGSQSVSFGVTAKVGLNAPDVVNRMKADVTNHRITVTEQGYYRIEGTVGFALNATAAAYNAFIYQNGSPIATGATQLDITTSSIVVPVSAVVSLAAGDYIELFGGYSAGSSSINLGILSIIKL